MIIKSKWKLHPKIQSNEFSLHIVNEPYGDEDYDYEAYVKYDGCVNFYKAGNFNFNEDQGFSDDKHRNHEDALDNYIHICHIDNLIEALMTLKMEAQKYFGEKWPRMYD